MTRVISCTSTSTGACRAGRRACGLSIWHHPLDLLRWRDQPARPSARAVRLVTPGRRRCRSAEPDAQGRAGVAFFAGAAGLSARTHCRRGLPASRRLRMLGEQGVRSIASPCAGRRPSPRLVARLCRRPSCPTPHQRPCVDHRYASPANFVQIDCFLIGQLRHDTGGVCGGDYTAVDACWSCRTSLTPVATPMARYASRTGTPWPATLDPVHCRVCRAPTTRSSSPAPTSPARSPPWAPPAGVHAAGRDPMALCGASPLTVLDQCGGRPLPATWFPGHRDWLKPIGFVDLQRRSGAQWVSRRGRCPGGRSSERPDLGASRLARCAATSQGADRLGARHPRQRSRNAARCE